MRIGTPLSDTAVRVMLLGAGELGKEVAIELQRLGVEVIAVDRYPNAPAMQVAHRSHVIPMTDAQVLNGVILAEAPHIIVPEIEAIATEVLAQIEAAGLATVIPTARATQLTMNREGIRRLAAEELGLPTSPYAFVGSAEELREAAHRIGLPVFVKPVMSSSGKGQSVARTQEELAKAWEYAVANMRGDRPRVIVEEFIAFDSEITLLTVSTEQGVIFCPPIGHEQDGGDYRTSWQPAQLDPEVLASAQRQAEKVVRELGGHGLFGVEFFIAGNRAIFSELSPRPHDTGMVTLIGQRPNEFELHLRAILGLPIPSIESPYPAAASAVILAAEEATQFRFEGLAKALGEGGEGMPVEVRLFGKPDTRPGRRMGVALATGDNVESARTRALAAAGKISIVTE
jgi:phosphoribosylglycinamide formyltransferase 2